MSMSVSELGAWLILPALGIVLYALSQQVTNEIGRMLIRLLAFGLAEAGIIQASFASYFGPIGQTPGVFWLTSGFVIGVLLLVDRRHYLYYVFVSILVHVHAIMIIKSMPWDAASGLITANLTEQVVGSLLLRYVLGGTPDITRPRTFVLYCLICVGFATALSAVIGSATLAIFFGQQDWFRNWQIWWFSDAMGMLSLGSAILAWNCPAADETIARGKWSRIEACVVILMLILTAAISIGPFSLKLESFLDFPYLVLPLLVWAALRLNARLAISAAVAVAAVTVFTANGTLAQLPWVPDNALGPFRENSESVSSAVLAIQAFLFVALLTTQILVTLNYQRQRAENDRLAMGDQLYESQRMESVAHLASGVAHDLNNLLAVIAMYRDQVEERVGDDPTLTPALEAMDDAAGNAVAMSRSLLDLGRQEKIKPGPLNLRTLLQRTMQVCRPLLPKTMRVQMEIEIGRDLIIQGDANHLQQVILNLVLNARDAMPPGGGVLSIWARQPDPSTQRIEIGVRDTGSGISAQDLKHVFEPLFTTKPVGKGTGLGLSIVKRIIEAHGGTAEIDSAPGKGTTVKLYLPYGPADANHNEPIDSNRTPLHLANTRFSRDEKVDGACGIALVYIENPQIRGAVIAELHEQGWDFQTCHTVEHLMDCARKDENAHRRACAIIDLRPIANPDVITQAPLPLPTIVLTDQRPPPKLVDPNSVVLPMPFKIKYLLDTVNQVR